MTSLSTRVLVTNASVSVSFELRSKTNSHSCNPGLPSLLPFMVPRLWPKRRKAGPSYSPLVNSESQRSNKLLSVPATEHSQLQKTLVGTESKKRVTLDQEKSSTSASHIKTKSTKQSNVNAHKPQRPTRVVPAAAETTYLSAHQRLGGMQLEGDYTPDWESTFDSDSYSTSEAEGYLSFSLSPSKSTESGVSFPPSARKPQQAELCRLEI